MVTGKKEIAVEVRCKECGKLFFKFFKEDISQQAKKGRIEIKCTRCGKKNRVKV